MVFIAEKERAMKRTTFPMGAALLAALCGLLMSTLPYICWYVVAHSSIWIADADEVYYTLIASHAYYYHPFYLSDPAFVHGGQSPYSWLSFVPSELFCKAFGLQPIRFGLIMRIFCGLAIGFGWYAVIWQHVRRRWAALLGALFLLTDCGWQQTRPFVRQWTILTSIALHRGGEIFAHQPSIFHDWRIISPVAVLPFLLLYLWALGRSVKHASRANLIGSGIAFGVLFHAYLFFWTAAGLGLALGLVVDRARWRTYCHTMWIGILVGIPELGRILFARILFAPNHSGAAFKESMQRGDYLVRIPRLSEHGHFILSALLVLATFFVVHKFQKELLYLWCLCAAGFIMIHEQFFTGLEMENYHWAYLFCPCMILLLTLLANDALDHAGSSQRWLRGVVVFAVLLNVAAGFYLRVLEGVRTRHSQQYSFGYPAFAAQHGRYAPLSAGAETAGIDDFVQYAMIVDHVSPLGSAYPVGASFLLNDSEIDRRFALDRYLCGTSRAAFEEEQQWGLDHQLYGIETRDLARRQERLRSRMMWFDKVASDPTAVLDSLQVRYVGLPAGTPRPATLGPDWFLLQNGPAWEVWERQAGR